MATAFCFPHWKQAQKGELREEIRVFRGPDAGCLYDGCSRTHCALGFCEGHLQQLRKGRPMTDLPPKAECAVPGCWRDRLANLLCNSHNAERGRGIPFDDMRPFLWNDRRQGAA